MTADEGAGQHTVDDVVPQEPQTEAPQATPGPRGGRRRLAALVVGVLVVGAVAALQCQASRLTRRAEALLDQRKPSEALAPAQQAARWAPWYGPAYIASGRAQVRGAPTAAIIDLSLGLTLAPRHGEDGYVALCQIANGPIDSANSTLGASTRGLRRFPTSRYLVDYHAEALYRKHDYAGAYSQYRRALTLPGPRPISDQNRALFCMRLAECAHRLSKPLESAGWYCQADALSGRDDPNVARHIVTELALAGDVAKALRWNAETVRRDPSPYNTRRAVYVFVAAGRWDQAMAVLSQAARQGRLVPGDRERCLARAHNQVGNYAQALALARECYAAAQTGGERAYAAVQTGVALVGMGRYAEGVTWLESPGTWQWGREKYGALVKAYTQMGETAKKNDAASQFAKYSDDEKLDAALADFARRNPVAAKTGA